jgi:hypothetical protein
MNIQDKLLKIKNLINFAEVPEEVKADISALIDQPIEEPKKEEIKEEVKTEEVATPTLEERLANVEELLFKVSEKLENMCNTTKNFADEVIKEEIKEEVKPSSEEIALEERVSNLETLIGDALLAEVEDVKTGEAEPISEKLESQEKEIEEIKEEVKDEEPVIEEKLEVKEEVEEKPEETPSEEPKEEVKEEIKEEVAPSVIEPTPASVLIEDEDEVVEDEIPTDKEISENFSSKKSTPSNYGSVMDSFMTAFRMR